MQIIKDYYQNIKLNFCTSIALGMFDGIHLAHQTIIKKAVECAKSYNYKSVVLTFDRDVEEFLKPDVKHLSILDNKTKCHILKDLGVDIVIFLKLNNGLINLKPETFLKFLVYSLNAKVLNCGFDYRFGHKAIGDVSMLNLYKDIYGYELNVFNEIQIDSQKISSSLVRIRLAEGNIEETNKILGYTYCLCGTVEKGQQIARRLGFPTANFEVPDNIAIKNGVYVTKTVIDEKIYKSITNIGYKPTFNGNKRLAETFVFDFNQDLYDREICIKFYNFIRDEMKFNNIEELKARIEKDVCISKYYFNNVFTR